MVFKGRTELKLGRQAQIFLLAGLLLAAALILSANGTLAKASSNLFEFAGQQRSELNGKLTSTQARLKMVNLESPSAERAELERQIAQNTEQRDEVKAMIAQPINKSEIISTLFRTARTKNVEITKLNLAALSDGQLAGVPVSSVTLTITAGGDLPDTIAFILELNTLYTYGTVNRVSITNRELPDGQKANVDLSLTLYSVQDK